MTEKRVELIRKIDDKGTLVVDAELKADGSLEVFLHDIGDVADQMFGDRDYEHWVTIPPENVGALSLALIQHLWSGSTHAIEELKDLCKANGIEVEEHSY